MYYAPVLISVLDRDVHFKNCVDSLSECTHAKETHVFIALDAPFAARHVAGYERVLKFLDTVTGFKELTVFKRETNMGSSKNQFLAMEDIFRQYDRLIFSEDDNVFSPNFLDYINKGLELFKDRKDIFSVSGHNYSVDMPDTYKSNYYIWPGFDAWGVGIWKDKWNEVLFTPDAVQKKLLDLSVIQKLEKTAGHYLPHLLKIIETKHVTDDAVICLHLMQRNMASVFPVTAKVRNNGHDNSGEHSGFSLAYMEQKIDTGTTFTYGAEEDIINSAKIYSILKKHFKRSWRGNIKTFLKLVKIFSKSGFRG
ncbi:MAG: hypothetical protein HYV28_19460 [Ignavibacteriales bacterium]|nr:hypothetical protein [Ignavibacteriales bacterium]